MALYFVFCFTRIAKKGERPLALAAPSLFPQSTLCVTLATSRVMFCRYWLVCAHFFPAIIYVAVAHLMHVIQPPAPNPSPPLSPCRPQIMCISMIARLMRAVSAVGSAGQGRQKRIDDAGVAQQRQPLYALPSVARSGSSMCTW
jgi:hypothetical protein